MKTKNLFGILILFLLTFSFISCDKDDLTDKVEIVKCMFLQKQILIHPGEVKLL